MLALILAVAAVATTPTAFQDEREMLGRRLETLRRILPDGPTAAADAGHIKDLAEAAHLLNVETTPRPPAESGARGIVTIDLKATGRFMDVERFYRQLTLSQRLVDVEGLTLNATNEGVVYLSSTLRFPYRVARAPATLPPDEARHRPRGVPKGVADEYVRDLALSVAKSEAIVQWRRTRRNPRLLLSELAAVTRDRPVALRQLSAGDEFRVRGVALAEGATRDLERRMERGFFRLAEFLVVRQGACMHFEARGTAPVVGVDAELPLPTDEPFDQDDGVCRVNRDPSPQGAVKGSKSKKPSTGPLTLRLRDIDLADVFAVLHQHTGQGFLVDGDVMGRVDVELSRVTPEEALSALASQGLRIEQQGRLWRVSRERSGFARGIVATAALPETQADEGPPPPPVSLQLKRAEVRDILAAMTDMHPAYAALGPQGPLGRVSLWVKNARLADVRYRLLQAVGLAERIDEGRRLLERDSTSGEQMLPVAADAQVQRVVLRAQDLVAREVSLAGVATATDGWRAYCYAPNGTLCIFRPGDKLSDGVVREIESTDMLLDTDEGPLRITLPGTTR
jgi:hypothetical protein